MINNITYNQFKDTLKDIISNNCTNISNYSLIKNNKWFNDTSEINFGSFGGKDNTGIIKIKCATKFEECTEDKLITNLSWIDVFSNNKSNLYIYSSDLLNLIYDTQRYLYNNISFITSSFAESDPTTTLTSFTYFNNNSYTPSYRAKFLGSELITTADINNTLITDKFYRTVSVNYNALYNRGSNKWIRLP